MTTLLAFSGSLRADSFNSRILLALPALAGADVKIIQFNIKDLPLYDQDLDGETVPEVVAALRAAISEVDGVIIATPEYNHSYSAVTKNLIDWASRPFMKGPIIGKRSMVIAAGPGPGGGVHALEATSTVLELLGGTVVGKVGVAGVHEKLHAETGAITDSELAQQLSEALAAF